MVVVSVWGIGGVGRPRPNPKSTRHATQRSRTWMQLCSELERAEEGLAMQLSKAISVRRPMTCRTSAVCCSASTSSSSCPMPPPRLPPPTDG